MQDIRVKESEKHWILVSIKKVLYYLQNFLSVVFFFLQYVTSSVWTLQKMLGRTPVQQLITTTVKGVFAWRVTYDLAII